MLLFLVLLYSEHILVFRAVLGTWYCLLQFLYPRRRRRPPAHRAAPSGHRSDSTPVPCSPDSLAVWLLQYSSRGGRPYSFIIYLLCYAFIGVCLCDCRAFTVLSTAVQLYSQARQPYKVHYTQSIHGTTFIMWSIATSTLQLTRSVDDRIVRPVSCGAFEMYHMMPRVDGPASYFMIARTRPPASYIRRLTGSLNKA